MREPPNHGVGHFLIPKNRIPVGKTEVAGQKDRHPFVKIADELKEHLCPILIDGQEPEFIKDEQVNPGELCGETREAEARGA